MVESNVRQHVQCIVSVDMFLTAIIVQHVVVDHRIFAQDVIQINIRDIVKVIVNPKYSINRNKQ
jgi:hypothetical protein